MPARITEANHSASSSAQPDDAQYLALKARDARFDGRFFTGITSTGIYCRPVCKVRTPKRSNCRFFELAAQAEAAGFRPCLRCRPELAPAASHAGAAHWSTQDASAILALQAAQLLADSVRQGDGTLGLVPLAKRMGVSDRHLRRIFAQHWGISPLQYLQTQRLLNAKQLLTDTRLPVSQIARLSGFSSLRRFNTVFLESYRLQPLALRKGAVTGQPGTAAEAAGVVKLKLGWRPPYAVATLLQYLERRSIATLETVDIQSLSWARTLEFTHRAQTVRGWIEVRFVPQHSHLALTVSDTLVAALPEVLIRVRAALDLDADPQAIDDCLCGSFPGTEGMRVPGTLDGFELAVRAILGQQITVAAARTLCTRLVEALGEPCNVAGSPAARFFPSAQRLAGTPPEVLGALGIVRQRQAAIIALARAVAHDGLNLQPGPHAQATLQSLLGLPGIGAWTAQYVAMRALRLPDAFPSGDVALQNALQVRQQASPARAAELASKAWQPWRAYAVLRAWHSLPSRPSRAAKPPTIATSAPKALV